MSMDSPSVLRLKGVGWSVQGRWILQDIEWSVPRGACAAILGANGSGKTTLVRLLTGYLYPTVGSVEILAERVGAVELHALRRNLGIVDPTFAFADDPLITVAEVVETGFFGNLCPYFNQPSPPPREAARAAMDQVGLAGRERQAYVTLSTGEKRRALLARALAPKPPLLLLDEPTAGLDLPARETLLATLERLRRDSPGLTTLLITHHLEELSPGVDLTLLLKNGRVLASGPPEATLQSPLVSEAFGCPVVVEKRFGRWTWSVAPHAWEGLLART